MNNKQSPIVLISVDNMLLAREIQLFLEEQNIFTSIKSDNPASSIMNLYTGMNAFETIEIKIMEADFDAAMKILADSQYAELVN